MSEQTLDNVPLALPRLPEELAFDRAVRRTIFWSSGILGVALAGLLALVVILAQSLNWLEQADRVVEETFSIETTAADMATALRAYQITGAPDLLQPWEAGQKRIGPLFQSLAQQVVNDPSRSTTVRDLRALFEQWQMQAGETLRRIQAGDHVSDAAWNRQTEALFAAFSRSLERFVASEGRLRENRERMRLELRVGVLAMLVLAAFGGIPLAAMALHRSMRRASGIYMQRIVNQQSEYDELQERDAKVRESEWMVRNALEIADGGAWVMDGAQSLVVGDAMVARTFGLSPERCAAGEPLPTFLEAIHEADRPKVEAALSQAAADGAGYEIEYRVRNAGGAIRWLQARGRMQRDAAGRPTRMPGVILDVTERRAAEVALLAAKEKAEVASRAKDDFLAALSHELRTPLTPVLLAASSLRNDERIPKDLRADLAMIQRNIALEGRLIDDLLDLTRIAKGKIQLREERCDAHSLIALAVEIVRDDAQKKSVGLRVDLTDRGSSLLGDPARLQQVFWNLLHNAIKFTPAGGEVIIRARQQEVDRLRVEVSDTGIGLTPETLETVFRPFEQVSSEGGHRFGGLGLGLSIARAIVDLHGGEIHAESAGLGRGATFVVALPRAEGPAEALVESSAPSPELSDKFEAESTAVHLRLLVVEDHEPTLAVLERLLRRAGHDVTTATNVAEDLAAGAAGTFDVVVSDLGLPDGTGLELMEKLRAARPELRGIAVSGYGMENDLRRSREVGFFAHLVKPVDFEQLRRALGEAARS